MSNLRQQLAEKDAYITDLQSQIDSLDASFSDTAEQLAQAQLEKENLLKENASLASTVQKLNRDVAKAHSGKAFDPDDSDHMK